MAENTIEVVFRAPPDQRPIPGPAVPTTTEAARPEVEPAAGAPQLTPPTQSLPTQPPPRPADAREPKPVEVSAESSARIAQEIAAAVAGKGAGPPPLPPPAAPPPAAADIRRNPDLDAAFGAGPQEPPPLPPPPTGVFLGHTPDPTDLQRELDRQHAKTTAEADKVRREKLQKAFDEAEARAKFSEDQDKKRDKAKKDAAGDFAEFAKRSADPKGGLAGLLEQFGPILSKIPGGAEVGAVLRGISGLGGGAAGGAGASAAAAGARGAAGLLGGAGGAGGAAGGAAAAGGGALAAGLGSTVAALAPPVAVALAAKAAESVIKEVVAIPYQKAREGIEAAGRAGQAFAANDLGAVANQAVEGVASFAENTGIAGTVLAEQMRTAAAAVNVFKDTVNAFVERGKQLQGFSGPLAGANAAADVQRLRDDIREAKVTGPELARLTKGQSELESLGREITTLIKSEIIELLANVVQPLGELATEAKPFVRAMTNHNSTIREILRPVRRLPWEGIIKLVRLLLDWLPNNDREPKGNEADDLLNDMLKAAQTVPIGGRPPDQTQAVPGERVQGPTWFVNPSW